jgi:hypothetical protein
MIRLNVFQFQQKKVGFAKNFKFSLPETLDAIHLTNSLAFWDISSILILIN